MYKYMLKIHAEYDSVTTSGTFKEISRQRTASLLRIFAATREHWWVNWELLQFTWLRTTDQRTAAMTWDALDNRLVAVTTNQQSPILWTHSGTN
jgi:hypothetical protein